MRILIVVLLMLGNSYSAILPNVDFLLDQKLSPAKKYVRLKETIPLKKSNDPYYQLCPSTSQLFKFNLQYLSSYVRKGKLVWVKANLYQANEKKFKVKEYFIKKYGRNYEYVKYDSFENDGSYKFVYHHYIWKNSKNQTITLTEGGREYGNTKGKISFEYELEINNFPKKKSHRGPSQKSMNTVLLRVPVTGYYKTTALMRAFSYNKNMNTNSTANLKFKHKYENLWEWQKKSLLANTPNTSASHLYSYYSKSPKEFGKVDELLSRGKGFYKFRDLIWDKLSKQEALVIDYIAFVKQAKGEKSLPQHLNRTLIESVYKKDTEDFAFKQEIFTALLVGIDRKKETATLSLSNGELVKLSLKTLYARSMFIFYF